MGFYRLFCKANQWNTSRVQVGLPSRRVVAKAWRELHPQRSPRQPDRSVHGATNSRTGTGAVGFGLRGRSRYSTSTQIPKDVVLFQHDRTRFVRLVAAFCGAQTVFWTYLGHFAYTGLRHDVPSKDSDKLNTAAGAGFWSFRVDLGNHAWRYGFTAGCLAMGAGVLGVGTLFCRRSVSRVVLHKGGKMVTVATQSPLGSVRGRQVTVPLARVACHAHRNESPSFIPLKIKDHTFYFLLDKEGTINNVKLFDVTVGAYRPL